MRYFISSNLRIHQIIWKNMFSIGKNGISLCFSVNTAKVLRPILKYISSANDCLSFPAAESYIMNMHCLGCITILVYTAQSRIDGDTFTDYSPVLLFCTPRKHQPLGFLFSGGTEKQHRAVMGRNSVFFVIYRSN